MGLNLYKSLSEEALVKACCQKDGKAQRLFYEKFAPAMYPLCLRYVREVNEAEDVMILGFMKAFEKMDSYAASGSLGGWLRRIMINQALGHLRKNKTMYLQTDIEQAEYQSSLTCSSDHLEVEDLMKLVCQLPIGYRTVFNLYVIEGYSHKEISKLLNISENTSKSQLSRARGWLQKQLLKEEKSLKSKITNHE